MGHIILLFTPIPLCNSTTEHTRAHSYGQDWSVSSDTEKEFRCIE